MARHILALNPVVFLRWALPVRLCVPEGRFVRSSLPNFDDGRQPSVGVVARADYADPAKDSGGGTYLAITWERLKIGGRARQPGRFRVCLLTWGGAWAGFYGW